ncbi:tripartite tricarboxylate transporter substrate binding protein [Yangia mangrovi]|uniref:Tripartite tricarboxylate transporter substrate binding protein n=1 Tax=Alloyangia mangrovi TaxID=1779329 RepID=A0A2A3JQW6_9RHOB|nr:tripartite tricarboxylate transporter substrate binding protein [Alloyangia mangrovi]MCT4372405.1 tripartite tricarboxylate transporter substrate binding protein [Alloyangia mangrovi]
MKKTLIAAAMGLMMAPVAALADYPEKPITVVVPNSAGGIFYNAALSISKRLEETMGQPVTVSPMPGAATATGTRFVAEQPADGYTVEFIHEGAIQASLLGMTGFDIFEKFEPIATVMTLTPGIFTQGDAPFSSLKEMADYAKANPGAVKIAINTGSSAHVAMADMTKEMGIFDDVRLVHAAGGGPAFQAALLSGDVNVVQMNPMILADMVKTWQVKAIANTTIGERDPLLPDVPTMEEQGYTTPITLTSTGIFWMRRDTPQEIKDYWRDQIQALLADDETRAEMEKELKNKLKFTTGDEMMQMLETSRDQRAASLKELGLLRE